MKTTNKHFQIFQKEVHRLFDLYELNNWDLRFEHKSLGTADARANFNLKQYAATIALGTNISFGGFKEEMKIEEYIKECAKHEVLHCLVARVSNLARERFIDSEEFYSAEEELVIKLIKIIK